MSRRYVVLDRDGTINLDSASFIKSADEWIPLPGSLEAIALLNRHGFAVVVISNQSGVGRGLFDPATLDAMHAKMRRLAAAAGGSIEAVYVCPHDPEQGCDCRKPKPGLFLKFAADFGADLTEVYAVGDSLRDLQAAEAVGAKPILVKTGKGADTFAKHPDLLCPIFDTLYDAAHFIVSQS
ncbi:MULTISPECIES: D-glycero-beta-D-manno-heptose 1,7-bisphosphate 7-phosphatase [Methylomonas]|uniref:D-glycero-beta-D-manno-heptose 1,7-bisphosphate 7-phosphatase n=1 Tax=Methylomonas TaxID=416 RepID=UPI00123211A8|nr:D-glycero-beta-D-manno-heptose 1,7-bisphosphate 7-phosphatase [Methylomonas rhizoryzae]